MNNDQIRYRWSDAWLLVAIGTAAMEGPAEFWQIIAAGDAINHAIFTREEFESGLCRLVKGGWIRGIDGRFELTKKLKSRKNVSLSIKNIAQLLDARPWAPGEIIPHPNNRLNYPGFSSDAFTQAIKKYKNSIKRKSGDTIHNSIEK
ncbi:MAG: hypothetical protein HY466_07050 [Deltaproteobacteria bacterium]|nr:hypothetical protein [Deltaproteobacteria bacterium]